MSDLARRNEIAGICNSNRQYAQYLFIRGFVITNKELTCGDSFPFYSNWAKTRLGNYDFWIHNQQNLFYAYAGNTVLYLIGHAYNPFNMKQDENEILNDLSAAYQGGETAFIDAINELTGVFILGTVVGDEINCILDCSGMQYGCCGVIHHHFYAASHIRLIGDLCELETDDEYVKRLINYRWYKYMMGNYLPGNLTPFQNIKRIIPNTQVKYTGHTIQVKRFYPTRELEMCRDEQQYGEVIDRACKLMKNTMELITRKWQRPAISLTGGRDSNTTFAAANGLYDRFSTFSYVSMPREQVDADAAKRISEAFGVTHTIFQVPRSNEDVDDFEIYKLILDHNSGDIGPNKDNDTHKKIILMQQCDIDVEVKSWIGETIRAYAYKYFGLKNTDMPKNLKPRHYSSLFKLFGLNRPLLWQTDKRFQEYIECTKLKEHLFNYDESDFFVWEMMHGGKCGLNITTMKFSFDITIPYNNRLLLDLLQRVTLNDRISDKHLIDMKSKMNQKLADLGIYVKNQNETEMRAKFLKTYFKVNSMLPF